MTGLGGNEGAYFILAGFAVLIAVLLSLRFLRRRAADGLRPGTFGPPGPDMKAELEHLLAEIRDTSREEIARLDTRMRLLRQLLAECDGKAKELEALLGRPARPGSASAPAEAPPPARPSNPLHDQVYALLDSGKDLQEIGAATGLEKGEVELILGLRKVPPAK